MFNDKTCDGISPDASNQAENSKASHCSPLLPREGETISMVALTDASNKDKGPGRFGKVLKRNRRSSRSRRSTVKRKHTNAVESSDEGLRRCRSLGFMDNIKQVTFLDMMAGLTRTSRRTSRARQNSEELRELSDFPVKPYYNDYSDHSTILIPQGLQVKESKWTLCYQSNAERESFDPSSAESVGGEIEKDKSPIELERSFIQLRFTKSRRLVRICVLFVILIPLFSAGVDDCEFVEEVEISSLRTICIENQADVIRRRVVFMTIQLPISLVWFGSTFFKIYTDSLPWLPSVFVLLYGVCSIAVTIFGKVPDSGIYMNYLFAVWLFIRIPFYSAFVISWITVVSYCATRIATLSKVAPGTPATKALIDMVYLIVMNVVLTYAAYFWERTDRIEFIDTKVEAHIRANTQNLLNQIIPLAVQERIQNQNQAEILDSPGTVGGRGVIADEESDVSVLFSDIKGFTKFCAGVRAMDVVRALNTLYNRFDRKLEKLGVYKVETIGDAYFVSANCPVKAEDHARRLVQLGREMIQTCTTFRPGGTDNENYKFEMRIGVHSGKVCAGVVGYKMPRYHLFGQTVTIAECMESSGEPGKVQISGATKRYLEEWENESNESLGFTWIPRGRREVLPDVFLETYFIQFSI